MVVAVRALQPSHTLLFPTGVFTRSQQTEAASGFCREMCSVL